MSAIFLSDVHLRDSESVKAKLLIRFFQEIASRFEKIYILGDLFDVWPGTSAFLVRKYGPVVQALKHLVEGGHEVHYLEGNHDFRLGRFFSQKLGIIVHTEFISENFGDKHVYMTHGDLGNPRDLKYRALRHFLRRDSVHILKELVPQEWVYQLGLSSSDLSRRYQKGDGKKEIKIRQTYRKTAEKIFRKGYDVVLMGHTHLPDDVMTHVDGRRCRYINIGDWVSHFTYLEFDGTRFYTKTHPVKDL